MPEAYKFPDELENEKPSNQDDNIEIIASSDDEVEIEVVDDTPERDRGRKPLDREVADPTDEEIESYTQGAQKRIKELTHARHDERRAKESLAREKEELERLAQHMIEENKRLKAYVDSGTQQYMTMANQAAEAKLEKARRDLKAAQEAFDADAIVAAQEALAEATWEVKSAKNFKAPPLQREEPVVQTTPSQPARVQADEKTLRWQARNQWFGAQGFEEITSYALGLHQKLVNTGVDPRSDEYFEQIDARVKSTFPEVFGGKRDEPSRTVETPARKPAAVVAPATRTTGVKKVQLTKTQEALIKRLNLDPKKYVAEYLKTENQ